MTRRRRARTTKELIWDVNEWRRAWEIAMGRIDGAPGIVTEHPAFHHGLDMLDRGFADGDVFQFQLGLVTLMDCCSQAVERGDCHPWW